MISCRDVMPQQKKGRKPSSEKWCQRSTCYIKDGNWTNLIPLFFLSQLHIKVSKANVELLEIIEIKCNCVHNWDWFLSTLHAGEGGTINTVLWSQINFATGEVWPVSSMCWFESQPLLPVIIPNQSFVTTSLNARSEPLVAAHTLTSKPKVWISNVRFSALIWLPDRILGTTDLIPICSRCFCAAERANAG